MSEKVKVAIVGVGNCATSLIEGVEFYRNAAAEENIPGLMHTQFGPYHVGDIEFVAAFDGGPPVASGFAEVGVEADALADGVGGLDDDRVAGAQLMARSRSDISLYDSLIDNYRAAGLLPA